MPARKRPAHFGFVWPEVVHVHLGLEHGILIDDPDGHLIDDPDGHLLGSGKRVRWLTFTDVGAVDRAIVAPLIIEAARVAALPRDQRLALALDRDLG